MTKKQEDYLLILINRRYNTSYKYLSQVKEDGIGKRMNKVQRMSNVEVSALIDKYKD